MRLHNSLEGKIIKKVDSNFQGVRPKRRRKRGMTRKIANDIIDGANFAFGFVIL